MTTFEKVITRDGSITYHNSEFNEHYHSITVGALEEAQIKYVEPLNLKEGNTILDFCFGLGYNTLVTIATLKKCNIIGLELDKNIIMELKNIKVPEKFIESYKIIQNISIQLNKNPSLNIIEYKDENYCIKLIINDAAKEIKKLKSNSFEGILFDPFSPKKCPQLWEKSIFENMYRILKTNGRLTTYSCARIVRENLKTTKFKVIDGPCFGRKSPSTIGIKK